MAASTRRDATAGPTCPAHRWLAVTTGDAAQDGAGELRLPDELLALITGVAASGEEVGETAGRRAARGARYLLDLADAYEEPTTARSTFIEAQATQWIYTVQLLDAREVVAPLSIEVWDLEEAVTGSRHEEPPSSVTTPDPRRSLRITLCEDARELVDRAHHRVLTEPSELAMLCYGLALEEAGGLDDEQVIRQAAQLMGEAAARRFKLFCMTDDLKVLQLRRAGLRGMVEAARRRQEISGPVDSWREDVHGP
jgi:hypothetical protein